MKHVITAVLVLVTMMQGGFSDITWSACGIAAAIFLFIRPNKKLPSVITVLMLLLTIVYAASMFYNGITFEGIASVGRVLVVFLLLSVFCNINTGDDKPDAMINGAVFITGMTVAVIGFAAYCGILDWSGAIASGRLQSVFQYANAAGLFLGVSAFLIRFDEKHSIYAPVLETALILTQSVGPLIVYAAGWLIYLLLNKDKRSFLSQLICGFGISLFTAGVMYALVYIAELPYLAALPVILLGIICKTAGKKLNRLIIGRSLLYIGAGFGSAALGGVVIMRGLRPLATYLERMIHIADGAAVMLKYPLGLGPGAWFFRFMEHQSSGYTAGKLHSEFISAGTDAGIPAVIVIILLIVSWFKAQKRDKKNRLNNKAICVIMIFMHAALDIPFSFLSIVIILCMLIVPAFGEPEELKHKQIFRASLTIPLALFILIFSSNMISNRASWAAADGDHIKAADILDSRIIKNDTESILMQLAWYSNTGRYEKSDGIFEKISNPNATALHIKAASHADRFEHEKAAEFALLCAARSPHNPMGYDLLEEIIPHLGQESQQTYREGIDAIKAERKINPLERYIKKLING